MIDFIAFTSASLFIYCLKTLLNFPINCCMFFGNITSLKGHILTLLTEKVQNYKESLIVFFLPNVLTLKLALTNLFSNSKEKIVTVYIKYV